MIRKNWVLGCFSVKGKLQVVRCKKEVKEKGLGSERY